MAKTKFKTKKEAFDFFDKKMEEDLKDNYQMELNPIEYDKEEDLYIVEWSKRKVK